MTKYYSIMEFYNGRSISWTSGVPEQPLLTIEEAEDTAKLWREMMPNRNFKVRETSTKKKVLDPRLDGLPGCDATKICSQ